MSLPRCALPVNGPRRFPYWAVFALVVPTTAAVVPIEIRVVVDADAYTQAGMTPPPAGQGYRNILLEHIHHTICGFSADKV